MHFHSFLETCHYFPRITTHSGNWIFIGAPLATIYWDCRCFLGGVFSGPDLWVNSDIRRSPGVRLEDPGESFWEGKPLPERGLREPFHNSERLMAQGPPDIHICTKNDDCFKNTYSNGANKWMGLTGPGPSRAQNESPRMGPEPKWAQHDLN